MVHSKSLNILGISAFYHDSAACLILDGRIICAAQEERFSRIKHDAEFPRNSIKFCVSFANIDPVNIDFVVFYDKPFLKFDRLLKTYLGTAPKGFQTFVKLCPYGCLINYFINQILKKNYV